MKYLKLFENFQDIDSLCEEYEIENYTINDEGTVDVEGGVWLRDIVLKLPIKFGKVSGEFNCAYNQLTSLEGGPKEIGGGFYCSYNQLTSLEGCPKEIGGNFECSYNKLTSLEGCPQRVGGYFSCSYNQLTIIDYLPEWIEGDIYLSNNYIRDIKVEDKNYRFFGKCNLENNPINDLFQYWEGNLQKFIEEIQFEDFIRDEGECVDILRFEYALNGKEYKEEDITNYKLIWKE